MKRLLNVEVIFYSKSRKAPPFGMVYRPHFVIDGSTYYSGFQFVDLPKESFETQIKTQVELIYDIDYSQFVTGTHFLIKEGSQTVGEGKVI